MKWRDIRMLVWILGVILLGLAGIFTLQSKQAEQDSNTARSWFTSAVYTASQDKQKMAAARVILQKKGQYENGPFDGLIHLCHIDSDNPMPWSRSRDQGEKQCALMIARAAEPSLPDWVYEYVEKEGFAKSAKAAAVVFLTCGSLTLIPVVLNLLIIGVPRMLWRYGNYVVKEVSAPIKPKTLDPIDIGGPIPTDPSPDRVSEASASPQPVSEP